ncbi:MAG: hypothetical protein ACI8TE_001225 [Francisella sp.]|jgi:hypothetical protein
MPIKKCKLLLRSEFQTITNLIDKINHHIFIRLIFIRSPAVIKEVFQKNNAWLKFHNLHINGIREVEKETVVKIFSCGLLSRVFHLYKCSNRACEHTKKIPISFVIPDLAQLVVREQTVR